MEFAAQVDAERILKDLRHQWNELGSSKKGEEPLASEGLLRACAMTLIVAAESPADADAIRRTMGVLMHDHPSRGIVLCPCEESEPSARVFAECWMPFGGHRQICAEGIEITADPMESESVARLLVPLRVPDLPVVLWCRGPRAFVDRSLDPLFPLASKIVFDTATARHAPSALSFLRRMRDDGHRVADLAWTRLTPWREAVSHLFDRAALPSSARILHGGSSPDSAALLFSRWIEQSVAGVDITFDSASADPGLHEVTFAGSPPGLAIRRLNAQTLELRSGDRACTSKLPPSSEDLLMREELSILDGDPVFEKVLL